MLHHGRKRVHHFSSMFYGSCLFFLPLTPSSASIKGLYIPFVCFAGSLDLCCCFSFKGFAAWTSHSCFDGLVFLLLAARSFLLFACLLIFDQMPDIVCFPLVCAGPPSTPTNALELCSGEQLSYLATTWCSLVLTFWFVRRAWASAPLGVNYSQYNAGSFRVPKAPGVSVFRVRLVGTDPVPSPAEQCTLAPPPLLVVPFQALNNFLPSTCCSLPDWMWERAPLRASGAPAHALCSDALRHDLWLPGSPWTLSTFSSARGSHWAPPVPPSSLEEASWAILSLKLTVSHLLGTDALNCLMFTALKNKLFRVLIWFFVVWFCLEGCSRQEDKSGPCFSILPRSKCLPFNLDEHFLIYKSKPFKQWNLLNLFFYDTFIVCKLRKLLPGWKQINTFLYFSIVLF